MPLEEFSNELNLPVVNGTTFNADSAVHCLNNDAVQESDCVNKHFCEENKKVNDNILMVATRVNYGEGININSNNIVEELLFVEEELTLMEESEVAEVETVVLGGAEMNANIATEADITNEYVVGEEKRNCRQDNVRLRVHGKKYQGVKRQFNGYIITPRSERKIFPKTCQHKKSKSLSKRGFKCDEVQENARRNIHDKFWSLNTWNEKKSYVNGLVDFRPIIKRRSTNRDETVKQHAYDCYLPRDDGIKVRVCRNFFLSTTGLKKDAFTAWIQKFNQMEENSNKEDDTEQLCHEPALKRRKDDASNSKKKLKSDSVNKWLQLIPKVPSHYCRASSKRVYVEPSFRSISYMHQVYKEWCKETGNTFVERKKFCEVLENEKISIFKPRKDQCDTCVAYKEGNLSEDAYNFHIVKKDAARTAKENAISSASESTLVATMDLQSILVCPKLLVSKQYYSQKLQVHNFSIYVSNTKDVHLYVWHEGDGKVSSNEFTTCIIDFIKKNLKYKKVILISDGCAYQNKNRILGSALSDLSKKENIEIEQIILEKGHTMMEVDSVHSTLERLFTPPIYTPAQYVNKMEAARNSNMNKRPYIINHLDHTFFKNYEGLPFNFSSIRPGKRAGDPTVVDMRGLLYQEGEVLYKINHCDEWQPLPQRRKKHNEIEPVDLYSGPLKIEKSKFDSLQALKVFMHRDYHSFYDNLKYE